MESEEVKQREEVLSEDEKMMQKMRDDMVFAPSFFSYLLLSSLELSDTKVYAPQVRALLGTASHFCGVVVLLPHPNEEGTT